MGSSADRAAASGPNKVKWQQYVTHGRQHFYVLNTSTLLLFPVLRWEFYNVHQLSTYESVSVITILSLNSCINMTAMRLMYSFRCDLYGSVIWSPDVVFGGWTHGGKKYFRGLEYCMLGYAFFSYYLENRQKNVNCSMLIANIIWALF